MDVVSNNYNFYRGYVIMISKKYQILILIFLVVFLATLIVIRYTSLLKYDCSKCNVTFKDKLAIIDKGKEIILPLEQIFEDFKNETCTLNWDRNQGYIIGGKFYG